MCFASFSLVGHFISSMTLLNVAIIVSFHLVRCIVVSGRRGSSYLSCLEDQMDLHHHQGGAALILYPEI